MNLQIVERTAELSIVGLSGRLDSAGVDEIETRFNAAVVAPRKHAIVDMSGVEFLSSMGVRMLLTAAKALDRSAARLVLVAATPLIATALRHSALDELIPLAADLESARVLVGQAGA